MKISKNQSLQAFNTLGIAASARYFTAVHTEEALRAALQSGIEPKLVLGGGSNLLLTRDFEGLVIKNAIAGKAIIEETPDYAIISAGAGENWHELVLWCLEHDLGGIENLSLIPGTVGAAPIQNIGAYGVELKDVFHHLEAVEIATGARHIFTKTDCQFGYRSSIFKEAHRGRYVITKVFLQLQKAPHTTHTEYGAIRDTLQAAGIQQPTIQDLSAAVIAIRSSKLPDPARIGNSGSFFKNPEIPAAQFTDLQQRFPHIVSFPGTNGQIKVPAGWLIEQCGWKGFRRGDAGCYDKQALVLVNYGQATGAEIWQLAQDIAESVAAKFGIQLTPEVNVI